MADLDDAIEHYKNLLIYQYINQPKARATIDILARQALVDLLPIQVVNAFDLDTAIGDQLDILGEYIGLDRFVGSTIPRDYFTLDDYVSPLTSDAFGFTSYLTPTQNSEASMFLYVFYNSANDRLEDAEYRILLKLKVALNNSQNSIYEINKILTDFFGVSIFCADEFNMSISYFVTNEIARIITIARNENLLPKPMGVRIIGVNVVNDIGNIWGFTSYTNDTGEEVGFSSYLTGWADSQLLNYQDRIA